MSTLLSIFGGDNNDENDNNSIREEEEENEPSMISERSSEKESITQSLEQRPSLENNSSVNLEYGDIIEIIAPTNPDIHEMVVMIIYIDNEKLRLISVTDYQQYKLSITTEGTFTDESITQINILSRSKEKGYARQNGLLPHTWIDIHFGGDIPAIITGEITNLEGDMIEITTFPELRTIYINFGYKGLPENIPIEKIQIRTKPAAVTVSTLAMLRGVPEAALDVEGEAEGEVEGSEGVASIQYTESGESIISIPKGISAERNIRDQLHDLYSEAAGEIVFGEQLGEIYQLVEIPEENRRFGIDVQVNDMMDEMLSTIPNYQRTKAVLDNIHFLIERYKQLREQFSKFDQNNNVYDAKVLGVAHKPLIEHLKKMNQQLRWLIPVVSQRRITYDTVDADTDTDYPDMVQEETETSIQELKRRQQEYYKKNSKDPQLEYSAMSNFIQEIFTPYVDPLDKDKYLETLEVETNIEAVVSNLEDFYTTVVSNLNLEKSQYVIQRYNLGISGLEDQTMKTGKTIYLRKPITPNDTMTIRSLLMLPEPVIRFSAIDMPSTNIMDKTNLSSHFFMLHRYFRKKLEIQPHKIEDLGKEFGYDQYEKDVNKPFFDDVHEFFLGEDAVDENRYEKFLEVIIPKTRFLIRLIRKYLRNRLSFLDVLKQLEPFLVYPSDITYKQYLEIRYAIKTRMEELKLEIEQRANMFGQIRNIGIKANPAIDPLLRIIWDHEDYSETFMKAYDFYKTVGIKSLKDITMSTSEHLDRMTVIDNTVLYANVITSLLVSLITPKNLLDAIVSEPNIDDMGEIEKIATYDCGRKFLAKRYSSVRALQEDNASEEVYYDKDLDDTPYKIMKKYEKEKKELPSNLYHEFIEQVLVDKHDCPKHLAESMATDLIAGKKLVRDGDYAMLELKPDLPKGIDKDDLGEEEKAAIELEADIRKRLQYYRRMKGVWVKDTDIEEESFLDTTSIFCNISEKCYKNKMNSVCETKDETAERMKEIARKKMLDEFDKRYDINLDELRKEIDSRIGRQLKLLKKHHDLMDIRLFKYSRLAFAIGAGASQIDLIQSPHVRLRDMILGQDDFVKKQYDICRFYNLFCREPMVEQQDEDYHWKYCKDTNTKLLPGSLYELANAFVTEADYTKKLAEVCRRVGIMSDDGDSIVDKYSGFVLRKIDFSTEEGFDESGFRITTNDILEQDLGAVMLESAKKVTQKRVFENETSEVVYNVLLTICRNIDIPLESIEEFVMRTSIELFDKIIYTEASYQKKSDKQLKDKGKPLQPYRNYRDETRLTIIACNIIIAIQTAIPPLKSNRSFPGCVRSFGGFPLNGGVEDMSSLQYLACVLHKTTSSISIWESIKKYKPDVLVKRMRDVFDNFILKRSDIMELYVKKREYMILYPELVSPLEHDLSKWRHFMPPIVPFSLSKNIQNVSPDFESELMELFRKGSSRQFESIHVLNSKLLFFGYNLIENIQSIVRGKETLLKSSGNVPFLENACCNESLDLLNPIQYFVSEREDVADSIRSVKRISGIIEKVRNVSKPAILFHPEFTGVRHSTIFTNNLDDVELIYGAVIHYCNFDKKLPIPEKFKDICNEVPAGYNTNWSILEKIEFLKNNGVQIRVDQLLQMMNIVNQENIVDVSESGLFTKEEAMRDAIESLDMENSTVVDDPLRQLFLKVLDAYKPKTMSYEVSNELNDLKNYLIKANRDMYREIMDFLGRYGNLSDRRYSQLHDFLQDICVWKIDQKSTTNDGFYTIGQYIQNAVQAMSKTYPNILLNDIGFYKATHKHWGFSDKHYSIISQFITKYYEKLERFKGDRTISRLIVEAGNRLNGLNMFLQNLPIYTEIVKDFGEDVEGERIRHFYRLLDKSSVYLLFQYCFYSVIYEYIICTNDSELLSTDVEEIKQIRRSEIRELGNMSETVIGGSIDVDDSLMDRDADINEIEIRIGNTEELKTRVAALLLSFLEIEEDNKKAIDITYQDIQQKVRRNKDIERRSVIDRLTKMSIEQRKVEDSLKKYRLEHWNVGQQKGLYEYDAKMFDKEYSTIRKLGLLDADVGVGGEKDIAEAGEGVGIDIVEIDDMVNREETNEETVEYDRAEIDIEGLNFEGDQFDGDYYYNDGEEGDFSDDA